MNSARELHALLTQWSKTAPNASIKATRSKTATETDDYTHQQIRACRLLGETEQALSMQLAAGEDVSSFREFLPKWWTAVVQPSENWQSSQSGGKVLIAADTLATLAAYGSYLDLSSPPRPADPSSMDSSRDALNDIIAAIGDLSDVATNERRYVFFLLEEVRTLLDAANGNIEIDLIRRINELRGWLSFYADDLIAADPDSSVAKKIRVAVHRLMPKTRMAFVAGGYVLGATADTLQIAGGV